MDRVWWCCYLLLNDHVHLSWSPFLRNHTCVDTLNIYINLKEGMALLGFVARYMQCSYEKKRKKKRAEPWRLCSNSSWGVGRFSSSRVFQPLHLTVTIVSNATAVVVAAAAAVIVVIIAATAVATAIFVAAAAATGVVVVVIVAVVIALLLLLASSLLLLLLALLLLSMLLLL